MMHKLGYEFYNRDTQIVARELLGKYLVHKYNQVEMIGKIVETEAYLGAHDLAAHSSKGLTDRTKIMFGPAGLAYVYLIYGVHHCMNVVTEEEGCGSAVLIRAIEPIANINAKTNGPGLLCRAMSIDRQLNGYSLCSDNFYIAAPDELSKIKIIKRPRIGVNYARHWSKRLLRFYIKDNLFISKK
ncbi:MAG: DNA-3-methyladenine glycosylase [Burkholderiales bacterium]|jgi:DNA-3-methyladenine glycosylase|nr:DNA-3-methyladenine glycosylase [Burkholderiales bacterium]